MGWVGASGASKLMQCWRRATSLTRPSTTTCNGPAGPDASAGWDEFWVVVSGHPWVSKERLG